MAARAELVYTLPANLRPRGYMIHSNRSTGRDVVSVKPNGEVHALPGAEMSDVLAILSSYGLTEDELARVGRA
jgi:hypothetical protein